MTWYYLHMAVVLTHDRLIQDRIGQQLPCLHVLPQVPTYGTYPTFFFVAMLAACATTKYIHAYFYMKTFLSFVGFQRRCVPVIYNATL